MPPRHKECFLTLKSNVGAIASEMVKAKAIDEKRPMSLLMNSVYTYIQAQGRLSIGEKVSFYAYPGTIISSC